MGPLLPPCFLLWREEKVYTNKHRTFQEKQASWRVGHFIFGQVDSGRQSGKDAAVLERA